MKFNILIQIEKINNFKVNKELLKKEPNLLSATKKTISILCKQIKKYFSDNKIKVKTKYELAK